MFILQILKAMVVMEMCLWFIVKCFTVLVCLSIVDLSFIVAFSTAISDLLIIQVDSMVLVTICSVLVALLSLLWNLYYSRKRDSFHFQHRAKTKNEMMDLVSALKSIEFKADYADNNRRIVMNYSDESDIILKLRTSRSYYTFLLALEEDQRWWLDIQILVLARSINSLAPQSISRSVLRILDIIKSNNKLNFVLKKNFRVLMKDLCDLRLRSSNNGDGLNVLGGEGNLSNGGGTDSPDNGGGQSNGDGQNNGGGTDDPDNEVSFKNNMEKVFESFVKYLVEKKQDKDPDVMLFYGVFINDVDVVKEALDNGANVNCTDIDLMNKKRKDYEDFINEL